MPYSHHSHSGQFCGHAKNTLEEMVQTAIAKGFHTFSLTEHIPRPLEDFYPEEEDVHSVESLAKLFDDFLTEAVRVKKVYASQIKILIGFESEWIRPSTLETIRAILANFSFDFFMGSVHHTHTYPIDFDRAAYEKAREAAGGTDERLFEDYFDSQFEMLRVLQPPVVGHFDLIRLLSDHRDLHFRDMEGVWKRIERNLKLVATYGGILELNSSGLRKGLAEPYPCLPICQRFLRMGGRFAMSDDSHDVGQIGTHYPRLLEFIQNAGVEEVYYVDSETVSKDTRFNAGFSRIAVEELVRLPFWNKVR
ncbi:histidinol-phosphatase [Lentithecium fluviatile CBS 122367]|uniref:Histidinol-phosphatase n=1 Tax=Lentithecium fluviatile CBS 122367 TaxID=1168545 RepID=A0A6G1J1T5_9PLEO|nr:histidinol-phosphatase [Lentithecium fluviatile CBS 122367]